MISDIFSSVFIDTVFFGNSLLSIAMPNNRRSWSPSRAYRSIYTRPGSPSPVSGVSLPFPLSRGCRMSPRPSRGGQSRDSRRIISSESVPSAPRHLTAIPPVMVDVLQRLQSTIL